ncbi:hypothetical protein BLNAU_23219 [Blattamonas nauphoetae]|uniref:Uncharacterized protein n=1 Tax=Blattamonas nauphoetae TaxID=2049346 RepID=A0ABQ9WQW6_9EUKA|nr:hypothetical protein BLNAU_23219 [Blattamonas nauphoetae]
MIVESASRPKQSSVLDDPVFDSLCGYLSSVSTNLVQLESLTLILRQLQDDAEQSENEYNELIDEVEEKLPESLSAIIKAHAQTARDPISIVLRDSSEASSSFHAQHRALLPEATQGNLSRLKELIQEVSHIEAVTAGADARVSNELKRRANDILEQINNLAEVPGQAPPIDGW